MTGKAADTTPHHDDPDAPLTDDEFERGLGIKLARDARTAAGLSQAAFAERYGIPVSTLRDWEQGRRAPDKASRAYLRVIARQPEDTARLLDDPPAPCSPPPA